MRAQRDGCSDEGGHDERHDAPGRWRAHGRGPLWVLVPLALDVSFPGYLILQVRALLRWGGRCRTLARLPIAAMGAALAHAIVALAAGSNIWPLVFIFTGRLPFCSWYSWRRPGSRAWRRVDGRWPVHSEANVPFAT